MITFLFDDKTYEQKIKSVTNLRLLSFFLWKFFLGMIVYYLFVKFTQLYYVSHFLLYDAKFYFKFNQYLLLYTLTTIVEYYTRIIFQNYEENYTKLELAIKIILDPRHQTIFLFLNSVIMTNLLNSLQKEAITNFRWKRDIYESHLVLYG
jgi:hypothetical protein